MKKLFYTIIVSICLLAGNSVLAQLTWSNLGPDNVGSITRSLVYDSNGDLLAGSQGGGLWKSTNSGQSWERVVSYDTPGSGYPGGNPNISHIAVSGNTIYVSTGATAFYQPYRVRELNTSVNFDYKAKPDGFKGDLPALPGQGIFISDDNGATWRAAPATYTEETRNYKGPFTGISKVLVAKDGKIWVATAEGLFFSSDNLQTLQAAEGSTAFTSSIFFDIEESEDGTIFAGVTNPSFVHPDSLYILPAGADRFMGVGDEIFYSTGTFSFKRAEIAIAPSSPNIVYVAPTQANSEVAGVFKSIDNGKTWTRIAPRGSQGFAPLGTNGREALTLKVFPDNPDELIIAGQEWYTFTAEEGWVVSANTVSEAFLNIISGTFFFPENAIYGSVYDVAFNPNNPEEFFIGSSRQIVHTTDRGLTFNLRTKGYEANVTYSAAAFAAETTENVGQDDEATESFDAVLTGTPFHGTLYNRNYSSELPSNQGYGDIQLNNYSDVAASALFPGSLISQGTDDGLVRSLNQGESFERFYGVAINPQVANLTPATSDTLIDRASADNQGGSLLNSGTPAHNTWVLDEVIPKSVINNLDVTTEEAQEMSDSYVFFCSRNYVWLVNDAFGDGLQVKWNRVSGRLVNGTNEWITAITADGTTNHYIYVGTSNGKLYRLKGPHDLENFDATADVLRLDNRPGSQLDEMAGRWISDIAVDPQNADRLVLTYAGYGGDISATRSFIWATDNAKDTTVVFGELTDGLNGTRPDKPMYTAEYAIDPANDKSILFVGSENGLHTVRDIAKGGLVFNGGWTDEFAADFGKIPVYDVFVRKYKSKVARSVLVRQETRTRTLPDGTVITETINVDRDNLLLEEDNTVFVATHGRGVWATSSVATGRRANPNISTEVKETQIKLYPNPTRGTAYVTLDLEEAAEVKVMILGMDGRIVHQTQLSYQAGTQTYAFNTERFVPGMYLVRVEVEGETKRISETLKSVVLK